MACVRAGIGRGFQLKREWLDRLGVIAHNGRGGLAAGKDGRGLEAWPALGSGSGLALIKIDCEGCEEWFLAAAAELIKAWRPVIVIEIWNDELRRQNGARPAAWPLLGPLVASLLTRVRRAAHRPEQHADGHHQNAGGLGL